MNADGLNRWCYQLTGTGEDGIIKVKRCEYCNPIKNWCNKFHCSVHDARGVTYIDRGYGGPIPKIPLCDAIGVAIVDGVYA